MTTKANNQTVLNVSYVAQYSRSEQEEPAVAASLKSATVLLYDMNGYVYAGFVAEQELKSRRLRKAARALLVYANPRESEVSLVDFMTDLLFYCDTRGYDLDLAVSAAKRRIERETC